MRRISVLFLSLALLSSCRCGAQPAAEPSPAPPPASEPEPAPAPDGADGAGPSQPSCPVSYTGSDELPLILGGVHERCRSGCQPRDGSAWDAACKRDPEQVSFGMCEAWQQQRLVAFAKQHLDPHVLTVSPCELWHMLADGGRTLWLIGDSHTKQLYRAARCFLADFWQHEQGECAVSPDPVLQDTLDRELARGHPYRTTPRCIHLRGGSGARVCMIHSPIGTYNFRLPDAAEPGNLELLQGTFAAPQDIFLVSFGRWHLNPCTHAATGRVAASFAAALHRLGAHARATAARFPNVFFEVSPPDHLTCAPGLNGSYVWSQQACAAYSDSGYPAEVAASASVIAREVGAAYELPVLDTYATAAPLFWAHNPPARKGDNWDCMHWCRPGLPEIELFNLIQAMKARGLRTGTVPPQPGVPDTRAERVCRHVVVTSAVGVDPGAGPGFAMPWPQLSREARARAR